MFLKPKRLWGCCMSEAAYSCKSPQTPTHSGWRKPWRDLLMMLPSKSYSSTLHPRYTRAVAALLCGVLDVSSSLCWPHPAVALSITSIHNSVLGSVSPQSWLGKYIFVRGVPGTDSAMRSCWNQLPLRTAEAAKAGRYYEREKGVYNGEQIHSSSQGGHIHLQSLFSAFWDKTTSKSIRPSENIVILCFIERYWHSASWTKISPQKWS